MKLKPVFYILILLSGFVQCTIQKRLYNRGYHIEHRAQFRCKESTKNPDSLPFRAPINLENNFVPEKQLQGTLPLETDHVLDTAIVITNNGTKRDTVYVQALTAQQLREHKKEQRLLGVGIPMAITGAISAAAFSAANSAQISAAILFFGAIGWIFALTAIILMILFLIFLTTPVKEDATEAEKTQPKRELTKGERIGLILSLAMIGIIAAVFWIKGLA